MSTSTVICPNSCILPLSARAVSSPRFEARMELAEKDLLKTAEKLELEKLAKINFNPPHMVDLDALLCDTYNRQCPRPIHYHNRRDLIRIFNVMAKEIYGNSDFSPVVEEYGSFVMDIFNETSDLDLSINFRNSIQITRHKTIETLRKFSRKLRSIQRIGHVTALEVILSAKVPIIKVTDSGTGIECDLSVENRDGIAKSHIIRAISTIDERFQKLCLLMKSWAKAHNINSSKDATLNSLSIVSFVAFHLQTCNPPILPPFYTLLREGVDPDSVTKIVKTYTNYGKQNKESLAKLFVTLLVKLASVENLWQNGYCISSYAGSWILKSWKRPYSMSVEDFTDRSQNVARAVRAEGFKIIYKCIHNSIDYLSGFLNGEINGIDLMDKLFGKPMVSTLGDDGTTASNVNENKKKQSTLQNPHPPKRSRLAKNQDQNEKSSEKTIVLRTEPQDMGQMHVPSGKTVPNGFGSSKNQIQNKKSSEKTIVQDLQRTEPHDMGWMPVPRSKTMPNGFASFTPPLSYQSRYQSPFATPSTSTNFKEHHGYGPRNVPPPFGLNPAVFQGSYDPSFQSHHVSSHNSGGFVQRFHQNASIASNPYHGSFPHSSLLGRDYSLYNQRSG